MSPLFGKKTRSKRWRENQRKDLVCIINILGSTLYLSMLLSKELSDEIWLLLPFINLRVSWFVFSQIKCFLWRTIPTVSVIVIQKEERRGCYRRGRGWGSKVRYFYYLLGVLSSFIFPAQSVVLLPPRPPAHPPFGSLFSISLYTNKSETPEGAESQRELDIGGSIKEIHRLKTKGKQLWINFHYHLER